MLVEGPNRADGLQGATAPAALSRLPSDIETARREHRWRDRNNSGVQKRRFEACVAAYLRGLRTVRT